MALAASSILVGCLFSGLNAGTQEPPDRVEVEFSDALFLADRSAILVCEKQVFMQKLSTAASGMKNVGVMFGFAGIPIAAILPNIQGWKQSNLESKYGYSRNRSKILIHQIANQDDYPVLRTITIPATHFKHRAIHRIPPRFLRIEGNLVTLCVVEYGPGTQESECLDIDLTASTIKASKFDPSKTLDASRKDLYRETDIYDGHACLVPLSWYRKGGWGMTRDPAYNDQPPIFSSGLESRKPCQTTVHMRRHK